jgi:IS1 family transposase
MPGLSETLVMAEQAPILELDELWSFVLKKANKRWIWIALCRQTRQVVAFVIGDRSAATCQRLWEKIPEAFRQAHCFSDFWEAYQLVIPPEQHHASGKESGETAQAFGSGGTTLCGNAWRDLCEKRCRFQRAM